VLGARCIHQLNWLPVALADGYTIRIPLTRTPHPPGGAGCCGHIKRRILSFPCRNVLLLYFYAAEIASSKKYIWYSITYYSILLGLLWIATPVTKKQSRLPSKGLW
jgi:hypothetical protein